MRKEGYKTKNLNIASFLYTVGLTLERTTRENNEVFFHFTPKDKSEEIVGEYFSGTAKVNPRELFARFNDLKDLIFSGGKQ